MPFDELQQHVKALLGGQVRVELIVGPVRVFKTVKHLRDSVHGSTLACGLAFTPNDVPTAPSDATPHFHHLQSGAVHRFEAPDSRFELVVRADVHAGGKLVATMLGTMIAR
jgi:hypothetical protein